MSPELTKVLLLLAACVAMFIANRPRMDVVALMALVALPVLGLVSLPEALAGFSDPNVVLIAALFVIGEGLVRTGVTYRVGEWLVHRAGASETRLLVCLMVAVAGIGSVMSSTGVVAVFIPVVMGIARRLRVHPGRLMMPLAFAGLISGMLSLVATPPNMVLDGALKEAGHAGMGFFGITPLGLVVLAMGVLYMLVARRWITPSREEEEAGHPERGLPQFIDDYHLHGRGFRFRVEPGSPMVGARLDSLNLRREYFANVVAVERADAFHSEVLHPNARLRLQANDILLVDFFSTKGVEQFPREMQLHTLPLKGAYFMESSHQVGMAEVVVPPESTLISRTIVEQRFRSRHDLNVVGLRRGGKPLEGGLLDEKLRMGDILLIAGPWKAIRRLQGRTRDFVVLNLPPEIHDVAPALGRAPFAVGSLLLMVGLMVFGVVPNVLAALIAVLLMGAFRCITLESAYRSIHWQSLILIVGMIPFARALDTTGGIGLAVGTLMHGLEGAAMPVVLASLFGVTVLTGLFISNTATAVLMAPVALSVANYLQVSPLPFAMTVALASSCAFLTPVSSPVNTLVLGPGNYRFADFVKVGLPFTLLVLIATVVLVPLFFPW